MSQSPIATITNSSSAIESADLLLTNLLRIISNSPDSKLISCNSTMLEVNRLFYLYSQIVLALQKQSNELPIKPGAKLDYPNIRMDSLIEITNLPFTNTLKSDITQILNKQSVPQLKKTNLIEYFCSAIKNANVVNTLETIPEITQMKGDLSQKVEWLRERSIGWESLVDQLNKYEVNEKDRLDMPASFKSLKATDEVIKKVNKLGELIKTIKTADEKLTPFREEVRVYRNGLVHSLEERLVRPIDKLIKQSEKSHKLNDAMTLQNKSLTTVLQNLSKLNYKAYLENIHSVQKSVQTSLNTIRDELQSATKKANKLYYKLSEVVRLINPAAPVPPVERNFSPSLLLDEVCDKQAQELQKLVSTIMHFIEEMRDFSFMKEVNKTRSHFRNQLQLKSELKEYLNIIRRMMGNRCNDSGITSVTEQMQNNSFNLLQEGESSYISKECDVDEIKSMKGNWTEVCQLLLPDRQIKPKPPSSNCDQQQEYEELRYWKDELIKQVKRLKIELQEKDNEIRETKTNYRTEQQMVKQLSRSSVKQQTLEMTIGQLKQTVEQLQKQNKELSSQIHWIYNEHEVEINKIVENLKKELAAERNKIHSLMAKIKNQRDEIQQLMAQLLVLRTAESQYKKMEVKYREYESSYNFMKKGKEQNSSEGQKLRLQYQNQIKLMETAQKQKQKEFQLHMQVAETNLQQLTAKYEQTARDNAHLQRELVQAIKNNQKREIRIDQIDQALESKQGETPQQVIKQTVQQHIQQIEQLRDTNCELTATIGLNLHEIESHKVKIAIQAIKVKQLQDKLAQIEKQGPQQYNKLLPTHESLRSNQHIADPSQIETLTHQLALSHHQIAALQLQLAQAIEQRDTNQSQLLQTIDIWNLLNTEHNRLLLRMAEQQYTLDRHEQRQAVIRGNLDQKSWQIGTINRSNKHLSHLQQRLDRINNSVLSAQEATIAQMSSEISQLKQLNEYLAKKLISQDSKARLNQQTRQKEISELGINTDNCNTECNPITLTQKMIKNELKVLHSQPENKMSEQYRELATAYAMDITRIAQCEKTFQGQLLQARIDYKIQLVRHLQIWRGLSLSKTKLIFHYNPENTTNFRQYIDQRHNLMYIVRTIKKEYIACHFSGVYTASDSISKPAIVISLITNQSYQMRHSSTSWKHKTLRGMTQDDFLYFFSACELKPPTQNNLFKNFEDSPTPSPTRLRRIKDLISSDDLFESYQIHEVFYCTGHPKKP